MIPTIKELKQNCGFQMKRQSWEVRWANVNKKQPTKFLQWEGVPNGHGSMRKPFPQKRCRKKCLVGSSFPTRSKAKQDRKNGKKWKKTIILAEKWRKTSPADSLRSVHKPFLCLVLWGTRCLETCFGNHVFVKPGKQILGTTCRTFNETHRSDWSLQILKTN